MVQTEDEVQQALETLPLYEFMRVEITPVQ
jgi:hypothetical protein